MNDYATIKVERFRKRFQSQYGDGHYFFACHAAFPIAFSVDMLYQLWANFKDIPAGAIEKAESPFPIWSRTIDRLAVSDLLQSDLCRRTDRDLFEMETEVRAYLLQQLENYFTGERLDSLARFAYQYVDQRINDPYYGAFRDTQRWVSMARLAPEKAGEQLVAYYNLMLEKDNAPELARLDAILEALKLMDARFADLSAFSKAIKASYTDLSEEERLATIQDSMKKVVRIRSGMAQRAGGLKVRLNEQLKKQSFTFKKEISEESDLLALRLEQAEEKGGRSLNLSGLDLTYLPKEAFRYPALEILDLSQNRLSQIPMEIEQFKNLRQLILDHNKIIDLPENLGRLELLEDLSLKNNGIDFLPPWISGFSNLKRLDLRGNPVENIRRDQLLFENSADFSKLEGFFFPEPTGFNQPMVMILIADPWERSAVQRALEPAVERGLLHIEEPESGQPWRLFHLLRQFRGQTCLLHINGSGVEENFTYQFGSPPKTHSLPLRAWNKIVDAHGNGQLCFISGGTGKRVVEDMLRRTFKACIYTTDFQTTNEEATDSFVSAFYGGLSTGRTLGEAFEFANNMSDEGLKKMVQQQSSVSDSRQFSLEVRDPEIMNWRLTERDFPESFASLEALKNYLEEWLLQGWPGSLFPPLRTMLSQDSEKFRELGALQDEWEQLQSEEARRGFWESEESPMRMFLREIGEGDLRQGVIEEPVSQEGSVEVRLSIGSVTVELGAIFCLPVSVRGFHSIIGMQLSFNYDPVVLDFVAVRSFNLSGLSSGAFGTPANGTAPGVISLAWVEPSLNPITLNDESVIFEVCFKPKVKNATTNVMFSSNPTSIEVTNGNNLNVPFFGKDSEISIVGGEDTTMKGKNYLFVIGIDKYKEFPETYNAVKGSKELIELLISRYKFEQENVFSLFNEEATAENFYRRLKKMITLIKPEDNLLIYFSGHGEYNEKLAEGYWIPFDGEKEKNWTFIDFSKVKSYVKAIKSLHTIIIADSAYSGTFFSES